MGHPLAWGVLLVVGLQFLSPDCSVTVETGTTDAGDPPSSRGAWVRSRPQELPLLRGLYNCTCSANADTPPSMWLGKSLRSSYNAGDLHPARFEKCGLSDNGPISNLEDLAGVLKKHWCGLGDLMGTLGKN